MIAILGILVSVVMVFVLPMKWVLIFAAIFLPVIFFGGLIIRIIIMILKSHKRDEKNSHESLPETKN
jgi:hypothetical protein